MDVYKPTVAIIFGGRSPEYSVSLKSAAAVLGAIDREKYTVAALGIGRDGAWFRYRGDASSVADDTWRNDRFCERAFIAPDRSVRGIVGGNGAVTRLDAAFPVLHGKFGEDGTVQGLLELADIPVIGCGTYAGALCMDKHLSHVVAKDAGIAVPRGIALHCNEFVDTDALTYPAFVKPARAGSSFGITCVDRAEDLLSALENAFAYDDKVVIEERIDGFEVGCAVIGNGDGLIIGAVDEIELSGDFFDFEEKYTLKTSKIHVPARISRAKSDEIKATAARIYRALGCTGFARVDMFVRTDGAVIFNEVNTIPGLTEHSRFPKMLEQAGYPFAHVVNMLIENALPDDGTLPNANVLLRVDALNRCAR